MTRSKFNSQFSGEKHTVHWFRKGLRLHDNPAIIEGLTGSKTLRCIFIIDPWFAGISNAGINKWRFLLQCLEDLDQNLRKLNSRLFVIRGQPADALPKLFRQWGTTCLTFEEDPEPFGKVRDDNIAALCKESNITVIKTVSHTLYDLETIIELNGGEAPLTYNQFQAIVASMEQPAAAVPTVTLEHLQTVFTPISEDHDEKYGVPTLYELGFETDNLQPPVWIGGETEALIRLERHLERKAWVASFGRPKMTPQSLLASQTGLSPMQNNPICVQIPWQKNPDALVKWAMGFTGFPWIDAIMTQLRNEGWIHHLARHAVACFLTRGDLWISWEEGMKVFDELLLDADWSVNAGQWMWLSGSSFFQQIFHCYCPVRFGRKADPNGDYIRKYLPCLRTFPLRYIHEPWSAPEDVQRVAKCIIGQDYPLPIVNHIRASRINMDRMRQAYQQLSKYRNANDKSGKQLSTNVNASHDNVPAGQQFDKGFLQPQRISIPSDSTYNQSYAHQLHQYKPELFAENINYNSKRDNTHTTVLAYSYNRQTHYDDKFENFDFSTSSLNANASNYVDDDQKDVGHSKHRKCEINENFDSYMEAENENDPNRMT
ncbi:hypothetical protein HA402_006672 [Bradysia odoriphaga]|nr:hypothetical protein HA402_006672 [Bradysia odoriphaga]